MLSGDDKKMIDGLEEALSEDIGNANSTQELCDAIDSLGYMKDLVVRMKAKAIKKLSLVKEQLVKVKL